MTREDRIVKHLIEQAFLNGANTIRVYDPTNNQTLYMGGEFNSALDQSKGIDEVGLGFRKDGERLGAFFLIRGNGDDIISDHTDNAFCDKLFTNTTATFGLIQ